MQKDIILALSLAQKKFYKYNTTIIYFNHSFFFFSSAISWHCCRKGLLNIWIQQLIES